MCLCPWTSRVTGRHDKMQGNPSCDIISAESGALCTAACLYTFVGTPLSQIGRAVFVDSWSEEPLNSNFSGRCCLDCLGHNKKCDLRKPGVLIYRVDIIIVSRKGNTSALAKRTLEEGSEQTRNMCQLGETGPVYCSKTLGFFTLGCTDMDVSVQICLWDSLTSTLWNGVLVCV